MKKFFAALTGILLMIPFLSGISAGAVNFPLKVQIHSESAMVINLDADMVIHERNADTRQMPGPLVNIMTAVICLEQCENLDEEITIAESLYSDFYYTEYPDDLRFADILDGDILTINDLLYAMMLTSSLEASYTLAYHVGNGSVDNFVAMMNDKASEIGLTGTNFTNPTGLYDANQYTTARDMAILTQYALKVPLFETIATSAEYVPSVPNFGNHPDMNEWVWKNSNIMMDPESDSYYPGAKGIKTANLTAAGRNIITMASRDGNNYLVVLLKAPINDAEGVTQYYHIEDATDVMDWTFNHFSYQVILADTVEIGELPVELAEGNDYVLARPEEEFSILWYDEIDTSLIKKDDIVWNAESLNAPVSKGDMLGTVTLKYSGEVLGTVNLVAVSDVKRSTSKYNMYAIKMFHKSKWFSKAIIISAVMCAVYIIICIYSFICYKNNSRPIKSYYAVPKVSKRKRKAKSPRETKNNSK